MVRDLVMAFTEMGGVLWLIRKEIDISESGVEVMNANQAAYDAGQLAQDMARGYAAHIAVIRAAPRLGGMALEIRAKRRISGTAVKSTATRPRSRSEQTRTQRSRWRL